MNWRRRTYFETLLIFSINPANLPSALEVPALLWGLFFQDHPKQCHNSIKINCISKSLRRKDNENQLKPFIPFITFTSQLM